MKAENAIREVETVYKVKLYSDHALCSSCRCLVPGVTPYLKEKTYRFLYS